jgi:hypothetical protein
MGLVLVLLWAGCDSDSNHLRCGSNPNSLDGFGETPFDKVLQMDYWDKAYAVALVKCGADVNLRDQWGGTTLMRLCGYADYCEKGLVSSRTWR